MPRNSVFSGKAEGPDFLAYSPNKDVVLPTNHQGVTINKGRNLNLNKLTEEIGSLKPEYLDKRYKNNS